MDATKEVELAKEYFVQGFPTLMLFRKGVKVGDYDGGRTSGEIVDYMRKQADPNWKPPPSVVLQLSQDNFTKTAKTKDLMLVSVIFFHFLSVIDFFSKVWFYAPWCKHCKQLEPEMEGAAVELEGWGITVAKVDIMFIILANSIAIHIFHLDHSLTIIVVIQIGRAHV